MIFSLWELLFSNIKQSSRVLFTLNFIVFDTFIFPWYIFIQLIINTFSHVASSNAYLFLTSLEVDFV